jgi:methylated-DNA-[protein]-cysteine S-methyltransferase
MTSGAHPNRGKQADAGPTTIACAAGVLVVGRRAGELVADWRVPGSTIEPAAPGDREAAALATALRRALVEGDESALEPFEVGAGTPFQRRVWRKCREIPRGRTRTYGELARALGLAKGGARAVGQALRRNPLPILVPCHRVVSAAGLGGYAGTTEGALAKVKRTLLELEREV